jgi:hypothetical protein
VTKHLTQLLWTTGGTKRCGVRLRLSCSISVRSALPLLSVHAHRLICSSPSLTSANQHLQKPRLSSGRQPFGNENAAFVWIEPQDVHLNFVAEHQAK